MKKISFFALAVMASMTLASCGNSTDAMIDKYEKALKNGNETEAMEIAAELDKRQGELSKEQIDRFTEITSEYMDNALEGLDDLLDE